MSEKYTASIPPRYPTKVHITCGDEEIIATPEEIYHALEVNTHQRKRIEGLCRWVGRHVVTVRSGNRGEYNLYLCDYCPIPKYRTRASKRGGYVFGQNNCPAAQGKHACSTELIKWFVGEE